MRWVLLVGQATGVLDFTGLATLVTAFGTALLTVGTILGTRRKRNDVVTRDSLAQLESRDRQVHAALRHLRRLEDILAENQLDVPDRPVELTQKWWQQRHGEEVPL